MDDQDLVCEAGFLEKYTKKENLPYKKNKCFWVLLLSLICYEVCTTKTLAIKNVFFLFLILVDTLV